MTVDVYNQENSKTGTLDIADGIFNVKWNPDLVHQVLLAQMANARKPWAHTKGRGEVRGGGRKPWRQKGTGRARHGSRRSPLWPGGGVTHGPSKERNYEQKINKKMRRKAIFSVLSKKLADSQLKVIDNLSASEPKTRLTAKIIRSFSPEKKRPSFLLIPKASEKNIYRASANLPKVKSLSPKSLNVGDLLKYQNVLMDREAVKTIESYYKI